MTYYDILGVSSTASFEEIRKAYRDQIKFFHPDVFKGPPEIARIKTVQLNEAYETLKDAGSRMAYDEQLKWEQQHQRAREWQQRQEEQRAQEEKQRQEEQRKSADRTNAARSAAQGAPNSAQPPTGYKSAWTIFAFFVLSLITAVALLYNWNYRRSIDTYLDEIATLEQRISVLDTTVALRDRTLQEKNVQLSELRLKLNQITPAYDFFTEYAVLVTEHGTKYHTYDCYHVEGRSFWIYNIDAAISLGYTACLDCNPPSPGL